MSRRHGLDGALGRRSTDRRWGEREVFAMRHIVSTAVVAVVVSLATMTAVGALAQEPGSAVPSAVSSINADRVDGKHAVGAGAGIRMRARKLVATNKNGYLPANIVKGLVTN